MMVLLKWFIIFRSWLLASPMHLEKVFSCYLPATLFHKMSTLVKTKCAWNFFIRFFSFFVSYLFQTWIVVVENSNLHCIFWPNFQLTVVMLWVQTHLQIQMERKLNPKFRKRFGLGLVWSSKNLNEWLWHKTAHRALTHRQIQYADKYSDKNLDKYYDKYSHAYSNKYSDKYSKIYCHEYSHKNIETNIQTNVQRVTLT